MTPGGAEPLELTLPGSPPYVAVLRTLIGGMGREMGVPSDVIEEVQVAVSEACNHVLHTLGSRAVLELRCSLTREGLVLRMLGRPRGNPHEAGQGGTEDDLDLPLMRALVDVAVVRPAGEGLEIRLARRFEKLTSL